MAEATKTPPCSTCSKPIGIFRCHGCKQDFCTQHVVEHRQKLSQQFDAITSDYDQMRQSIAECTIKSSHHPLMEKIDQWEKKSIKKIEEIANDARKQLLNLLGTTANEVTTALETLSKELSHACNEDTFVETDLEVWTTKLNKLKNDLNAPKNILVQEDVDNAWTSIYPIATSAVPNDFFGHSVGNMEIEDNGHVLKQGFLPPAGSARSMGEYSVGCYLFRFKIENLQSQPERKWIFFGIVSKATPVSSQSYTVPTVYGWAGLHQFFCNGVQYADLMTYESDMEKDDTLELRINCDIRKIRLKNTRSCSNYQLEIDVNKCPFPWQVFLCLYYGGDKVRILPPEFSKHTSDTVNDK